MIHLNITIHGRVQGVGFRFYAMEMAYKFGVRGFVANLSDGTVYAEAEGEPKGVTEFLAWCRRGPIGAHVTGVTSEEGPVSGFTSFDIRRGRKD